LARFGATECRYFRQCGMRSLRVIVSLILLVFLFACMTEQYALLPRTEETNTTVNHCLVSLGFRNKSQTPRYQELINSDAALVAVWSTPPTHSGHSAMPGTTAWIKTKPDQLRIRFIPGGHTDDNSGTAQLVRSFGACVPAHAAGVEVVISSRRSLDMR
jgi:hypothetical protein